MANAKKSKQGNELSRSGARQKFRLGMAASGSRYRANDTRNRYGRPTAADRFSLYNLDLFRCHHDSNDHQPFALSWT